MSSNSISREELEREVRRTLKEHWQLFVIQGIILVLLGAAAVAVPQIASIAVSALVGWVLFFAGGLRAITLYRSPHAPGYGSSLALAVLMAILGIVLALFPIQGAATLTIALVVYFIVHGIASLALAFSVRRDTSRWVLLGLSGLLDLVLAAFVIAGWPLTGIWVLGLYVGINLLFTGIAFIFAALGARAA